MTSQSSSSARVCSAPADSVASSRQGSWVLFTSDDPASANHSFPGGHTAGVTPVPIPNTEVKPRRADDTARVTVWERRSPPGLNLKGLGPRTEAFLFLQGPLFGFSVLPVVTHFEEKRLKEKRGSIDGDSGGCKACSYHLHEGPCTRHCVLPRHTWAHCGLRGQFRRRFQHWWRDFTHLYSGRF